MAATIYNFPIDIGINQSEPILTWTEEEIIRGYEENYQWEEDEYIMNQHYQDQNEQKNRQDCFAHRIVKKIIFIFQ